MIQPSDFLYLIINPGCRILSRITSQAMSSPEAEVLLLAMALQESGLKHRRQVDSQGDPIATLARGWWQFEASGGVKGVMIHPASAGYARAVCDLMYVPFEQGDIHEALAWNGYLALAFARLLLWTDAASLPPLGDEEGAWQYYLRLWRPGKPDRDRWAVNYPLALAEIEAARREKTA